ncbi:MAG: spondin domain-containing protein [Bacteroidota bacterium]
MKLHRTILMSSCLLLLCGAFCSFSAVAQQSTATYTVTFASTWSAATHPEGFPSNPHFSGLIGATHDSTVTFWAPGAVASSGIESMAETGSKGSLTGEVNAQIDLGRAEHLLSGGGIGTSPGNTSLTFDVSAEFPLVSLVSMLAPSPDWFVGVHGLNLFEQGGWIESLTVDLFVYDSGTDSGTDYSSANADTQPAEDIFRIESAPFLINDVVAPLATFTFTLLSSVNTESDTALPNSFTAQLPYPNPFSLTTQLAVTTAETEHVQIEVFDILGRQRALLFAGTLSAGQTFRVAFDASGLPAGQYIVRYSHGTRRTSQLITLIR